MTMKNVFHDHDIFAETEPLMNMENRRILFGLILNDPGHFWLDMWHSKTPGGAVRNWLVRLQGSVDTDLRLLGLLPDEEGQ